MSHKTILVVSDMHLPYQHKDSIKFLKEIKKEFKPDTTISIGDLLDQHALSFHDSSPELYSAGHELDKAKEYVNLKYKELIYNSYKYVLYII